MYVCIFCIYVHYTCTVYNMYCRYVLYVCMYEVLKFMYVCMYVCMDVLLLQTILTCATERRDKRILRSHWIENSGVIRAAGLAD